MYVNCFLSLVEKCPEMEVTLKRIQKKGNGQSLTAKVCQVSTFVSLCECVFWFAGNFERKEGTIHF